MWAQSGRFVHEILEELDGAQIAEYMAFDQIEPFGEQRADARSASVCATMSNRWRGKGERTRKLTEFMLFERKSKRKTVEEQIVMARVIHEAVGAINKAKNRNSDGH